MGKIDQRTQTLSKPKIPALDDSLRAFQQGLKKFVKPLLQALLLMSVIRFLIYWNSLTHFVIIDKTEILKAFVVGLRFDLLVLGFAMIPVVILMLITAWWRRGFRGSTTLSCWFLSLFWVFFCGLSLFDLFFYTFAGRHLSIYDFSSGDGRFATTVGQRLGWETLLLTMAIFLCVAVVGVRGFLSADDPPEEIPGTPWTWPRRLGVSLLPLFLVALAARGTVTAHHLEKKDGEVSDFATVNQLALNPLWAFDKKPEGE